LVGDIWTVHARSLTGVGHVTGEEASNVPLDNDKNAVASFPENKIPIENVVLLIFFDFIEIFIFFNIFSKFLDFF
jgi:hypothetical protein